MHTYGMFSGGPSSAVYVSRDGGTKWTRLECVLVCQNRLSEKIDVAVASTDSGRVYALIQTSDQGSSGDPTTVGENWTVASLGAGFDRTARLLHPHCVSPTNEHEVLVANSSFHLSTDGGKTFKTVPWGGDTHDIWIDPTDANRSCQP